MTFFIAVAATNLFHQGNWQRVYAAKDNKVLKKSLIFSFLIIIPIVFFMGFSGLIAVSENKNVILSELLPLYEKSGTSEKPDIWFISGAMNIVSKIMEMVEHCREEVMIAVPQAGELIVKQALPLSLIHI